MKAIRLRIFQPTAHYRIPYAYQRRLTYPLPPYATVLGMLRNLLGKTLGDPLPIRHIGIAGRYQTKVAEYTWLRSLTREKHVGLFGEVGGTPAVKKAKSSSKASRSIDLFSAVEANGGYSSLVPYSTPGRYREYALPEHPGGQVPTIIDTLHQMELVIHLVPEESRFEKVQEAIENPQVYEILHLGRAEDLLMLESHSKIELRRQKVPPGRYPYMWWIPYEEGKASMLEGLLYRIALRAEDTKHGRHTDTTLVQLWEGEAPYAFEAYYDDELKIPVFLQDL